MPELSPEQLRKLYEKKVDFIDHSLTLFDTDIERLQKELLNFLISNVISELQTENGVILLNEKNARLLANFDKQMLLFKEQFADSVFKKLGENMIKTTSYTSDYFRKFTSKKVIDNIQDKIKNVTAIVGVKPDGSIVKGGFIDNMATSEPLKSELSNYIRKSIESEASLKPFIKGLEEITVGNKDVKGNYHRYVRGFAHDAFFAQSQQQDNFFADQLGLDYFLYEGTKVKSSRPFCVGGHDKVADKEFNSKLGEVFSRKDAELFDSMDWEGKIPDIKFIVQKGGYQCRHNLRWITKDLAERLGYNVKQTNIETTAKPIPKVKPDKETIKKPTVKEPSTTNEFKPAKTIEDAKLWAKENMGIERYISSANVDTLNLVNKTLFDLKGKYNATKLTEIGGEHGKSVFASANNKRLNINKGYFDDIVRFEKTLNRCVETKYHPKDCNTPKSVIDHEFAHVLTHDDLIPLVGEKTAVYSGLIKIKSAYSSEIKRVNKKFIDEFKGNIETSVALSNDFYVWNRTMNTKQFIERIKTVSNITDGTRKGMIKELEEFDNNFISVYASKNIHEFAAESFASVLNSPTPSPFAQQAYDLINKYYAK